MYNFLSQISREHRADGLSSEISTLRDLLRQKENELEQLNREIRQKKEARRDKSAEDSLTTMMSKAFHIEEGFDVNCSVDPETRVEINLFIRHSAAEVLNETLAPMVDGQLDVVYTHTMHGQEEIKIQFPSTKLESLRTGLRLMTDLDLSSYKHTLKHLLRARC